MEVTQQQLNDIINTVDSAGAILLLNQDKKTPGLLNDTLRMQLSYIRMKSLDFKRFLDLASESVLAAYQLPGFDLYQYFVEYIENYDNVVDEIEICKGLSDILSNSTEVLGENIVNNQGQKIRPTISAWISLYLQSSPQKSDQVDSLRILQFLNSPVLDNQTTGVKGILKSILGLFGYCQKILDLNDLLQAPIDPEKFPENFQPIDIAMALSKIEKEELINNARPVALDAINTTVKEPRIVPQEQPIAEPVAQNQISDIKLPSRGDDTLAKPQPKRGLVFDVPTNIDLEEVEQDSKEAQVKQDQIAAKLEELKKRKTK